MPSLNRKHQVRYTQADINVIDGAVVLLTFMEDFDAAGEDVAANAIGDVKRVAAYMRNHRNLNAPKHRDAKADASHKQIQSKDDIGATDG